MKNRKHYVECTCCQREMDKRLEIVVKDEHENPFCVSCMEDTKLYEFGRMLEEK